MKILQEGILHLHQWVNHRYYILVVIVNYRTEYRMKLDNDCTHNYFPHHNH
jgi:hypothetical protein